MMMVAEAEAVEAVAAAVEGAGEEEEAASPP
jgi:hypothetical protein